MSPNNCNSLTSVRNTKPYEGNQWKSTAKHYPRIRPAGKVFRQPPFCVSMAISSETSPYVINTVVIIIIIYNHIFNIQNRKQGDIKVKSADVICQTSITFFWSICIKSWNLFHFMRIFCSVFWIPKLLLNRIAVMQDEKWTFRTHIISLLKTKANIRLAKAKTSTACWALSFHHAGEILPL